MNTAEYMKARELIAPPVFHGSTESQMAAVWADHFKNHDAIRGEWETWLKETHGSHLSNAEHELVLKHADFIRLARDESFERMEYFYNELADLAKELRELSS